MAKQDTEVTNTNMKLCSTLLDIRKLQINTTVRSSHIAAWLKLKSPAVPSTGKAVEKLGLPGAAGNKQETNTKCTTTWGDSPVVS